MDKKIEILTADTEKLRGTVESANTAGNDVERDKLLAKGHAEANDLLDRIVLEQRRTSPTDVDVLKLLEEKRLGIAEMRNAILAQRRAIETGTEQLKTEATEVYRRFDRQDFGTQAAVVTAGVVGLGLATRAASKDQNGKRERWAPWLKRQMKRIAGGLGILWLLHLFRRGNGRGFGAGNNGNTGTEPTPNTRQPQPAPAPRPSAEQKPTLALPPEVQAYVPYHNGVADKFPEWHIHVHVLSPNPGPYQVAFDTKRSEKDQQWYCIDSVNKRYSLTELVERLQDIRGYAKRHPEELSANPVIRIFSVNDQAKSAIHDSILQAALERHGFAHGHTPSEKK